MAETSSESSLPGEQGFGTGSAGRRSHPAPWSGREYDLVTRVQGPVRRFPRLLLGAKPGGASRWFDGEKPRDPQHLEPCEPARGINGKHAGRKKREWRKARRFHRLRRKTAPFQVAPRERPADEGNPARHWQPEVTGTPLPARESAANLFRVPRPSPFIWNSWQPTRIPRCDGSSKGAEMQPDGRPSYPEACARHARTPPQQRKAK